MNDSEYSLFPEINSTPLYRYADCLCGILVRLKRLPYREPCVEWTGVCQVCKRTTRVATYRVSKEKEEA